MALLGVRSERGRQQARLAMLQMMHSLEQSFAREVASILSRMYGEGASDVENGRSISLSTRALKDSFRRHIIRVASVFGPAAIRAVEKKGSMAAAFWGSMNEYTRDNVAEKVTNVTDTTRGQINRIVQEGTEAGLTNAQMAKQIALLAEIASPRRARMIARTETHGAAVHAVDMSVQATGLAMDKIWVSALDMRTRATHRKANSQRVPRDKPFIVGGGKLMRPGDPTGPAAEVINCRCVMTYEESDSTPPPPPPKPRVRRPRVKPVKPIVPKPKPVPAAIAPKPITPAVPKPVVKPLANLTDEELAKHWFKGTTQTTNETMKIVKAHEEEINKLLAKANALDAERDKYVILKYRDQLPPDMTKEFRIMKARHLLDEIEVLGNEMTRIQQKIWDAQWGLSEVHRDELLKMVNPTGKRSGLSLQLTGGDKFTEKGAKAAAKGLDFLDRLGLDYSESPSTFKVFIIKPGDEQRAFFRDGVGAFYDEGVSQGTFVHEGGHFIEHSSAKRTKMAAEFLDRRTAGEMPESLNHITNSARFDAWEEACPDKFIDPYTGKIYQSGYTEVVSMGLQHMFENPLGFYKNDKDHFLFIVNILRGG